MEVCDRLVVVQRGEPAELVVLDADVVERVGDLVGCEEGGEKRRDSSGDGWM